MEQFENFNKSYINGEWVEGESGRNYENQNPYDQSVINTIPLATKQQLEDAYVKAKQAQKDWAQSTPEERKSILEKVSSYLDQHRDEIVQIIARETGGSLIKASVEVDLTIALVDEATNMPDELNRVDEKGAAVEGKVNKVHRLPLGVITSISPFNFPMNLSMRTIAPAIALGNAVVHKPDNQTALTGGSILAKAFEHAGLPKGVFNCILTDLDEIGDYMIETPHSPLISFTGSTPVGKHIAEKAGAMLKRVALELGGNNPFIVLEDADLDRAVDAAIFGKFIHQGQICMIINRIIVHEKLYDLFIDQFVERVKEIPSGDPTEEGVIVGPLINEDQVKDALEIIETAKKEGANLVLEGKREGNLLTPYVFTDVKNDSELAQTELFAPIATIIKATTDDEAIEMANDTPYGLSSSIFTQDLEKGEQLALKVESGMTHINDQTVNDNPTIPFGGTKESGVGKFGNPWIVEEFTITKWVSIQEEFRDFPF
ncbi:aldehyde dehydrogenase family protein [Alkalibacillus haloalkaliphilus]|uniref:aldehyde dehydrogenase family protein n=1 Tax=Alkalibacillus haloalkaliphilus TaxID=94136 RepID=UPI00293636DC|nr:aldehyde dehydrogenase family protein [Alkalibacillus haloalkaliphilus]MDV2581145.1 aldehyde dehydrogenase family protein [Alkalibacillus haloalkaliphilus]